MFITAFCVLFLIKLRWPKKKSLQFIVICKIRILLQTFKVALPVTPRYRVIISCDLVVGLGLAEF